MDNIKMNKLFTISKIIRKEIVKMAYISKSSHVGSALSCVDILVTLYFKYMNLNKDNICDENRDVFILSKGHACSVLYSVLAHKGFFSVDMLDTYCKDGTKLGGHPSRQVMLGIEASTGSLGHALSIGCGMEIANRGKKCKTIILMGDGECNEGSVWEAAMFASSNHLSNLIAIVDNNGLQGLGKSNEISGEKSLKDKWEAFGWNVKEIDGNDYDSIDEGLNLAYNNRTGKPFALIAHTVKGKGVSFMENKLEWHYKSPNKQQYEKAIRELDSL